MEDKNNYAFPHKRQNLFALEGGLTKREIFAAMMMQGELSGQSEHNDWRDPDNSSLAGLSVSRADALLKALEEKK
jgi:hypothetical protein